MANKVTVVVSNGTPKVLDSFNTVGELREELDLEGYTASINGDPAADSDDLRDYAFVSFAVRVKGGL